MVVAGVLRDARMRLRERRLRLVLCQDNVLRYLGLSSRTETTSIFLFKLDCFVVSIETIIEK